MTSFLHFIHPPSEHLLNKRVTQRQVLVSRPAETYEAASLWNVSYGLVEAH